jgi:glucose/arabinose dehydrogenase
MHMQLLKHAWVALALTSLIAFNTSAQLGPPLGTPTEPIELDAGQERYRIVPIAAGLVRPWSIGFLPDDRTILVTEAQGRLRVIRDGLLADAPAWEAPQTPAGHPAADNAPLKSLAVHPDFARNGLIYVSHMTWGDRGNTLAVSRGRFDAGLLKNVEEIFVADAWETSGNAGGRILFGPDNTLYITIGDRDRLCCIGRDDNSIRIKAQDLGSHIGKTLRIRDDGGVPSDNPFVNQAGAKPEIYTYGHRNGYGLAFHPETGALWQAEIGPLGGDEINVLAPGGNYGWPLVSTGRNYTGTLVSDQPWSRPNMENPRIHWVPSISPSSIVFYTGDRFPDWKGSLFVGALTTRDLQRISFGNPSQDERRQRLLVPFGLRVRDVAQGPDGLLYLATERATVGASAADGAILRLEPAESGAE